MDKDKQINFLLQALKELAGGHFFPWQAEDARNMRDYAKETINDFNKLLNQANSRGRPKRRAPVIGSLTGKDNL